MFASYGNRGMPAQRRSLGHLKGLQESMNGTTGNSQGKAAQHGLDAGCFQRPSRQLHMLSCPLLQEKVDRQTEGTLKGPVQQYCLLLSLPDPVHQG